MKTTHIFRLLALSCFVFSTLLFSSCSKDNGAESISLKINPSLSELVDGTTSATSFTSGDKIGVYVIPVTGSATSSSSSTTDQISNRLFSFNGSSWVSTATDWPNSSSNASSYNCYAYAPYDATQTSVVNHSFVCPTDQSTLEKMHQADFVYGTATSTKTNSAVPFTMKHLFSAVSINIKYGSKMTNFVQNASLKAYNTTSVNLLSGNAFATGTKSAITMAQLSSAPTGYTRSYSCIVPVQAINGEAITFTLADGTTKTLTFSQSLEGNKHYSINTTVIGNEDIVIDGVSVSPWDASVTVAGGTITKVQNYVTGDVITYQKKRETNPVTVVVIPEGFTQSQLTYGGLFEQKARSAIDYMFNVEPYKTYKDYFNIYFLAAVSNEQGADSLATTGHPAHLHDTYFDTGWEWDGNYTMKANANTVFDFVSKYCPDIVNGKTKIQDVAIFMIVNDARYGGITWMYSDGKAFAICPMTAGTLKWSSRVASQAGTNTGDWRNTFLHEGGGHCFAKLGDEYWYDDNANGADNIKNVNNAHSWSVPSDLNLTTDISNTSTTFYWKDMIGTGSGKFAKEGTFEGGGYNGKGIWRSELVSCMIDNRRYFNAWSRYLIAKRIVSTLAKDNFSFATFFSKDVNYDEILDRSSSGIMQRTQFLLNPNQQIYPPLAPPRRFK